jgi:hypothetical protein
MADRRTFRMRTDTKQQSRKHKNIGGTLTYVVKVKLFLCLTN